MQENEKLDPIPWLEALNNIKQRAKWEDTIICVVLRFVHVIEMNTLRKQRRVYPTTLLMLMTKQLTDITSASASRVLTLSWNGPVLKWSIRICLDISLLKAGHIRYIYITTSKVFSHIWTKCWAEITQQEPETWQLSNLIIKTYWCLAAGNLNQPNATLHGELYQSHACW